MPFDSLFIGVSGLQAFQNDIDVISNNIANVGTTGYKGQRMTFQDLLYQTQAFSTGPTQTRGGINAQQVGLGVKTGTIDTLFNQGGLNTTGVNTDLAMNGDGFFILANANGQGTPTYTRNGAFSLNQNGLLYDPSSGLAVQGYTAVNGVINQSGVPNSITIPLGLKSQAVGTGFGAKSGPIITDKVFDVSLGGNLDQTQFVRDQTVLNSGQVSTISTTLYDSLGNGHLALLTYVPDAGTDTRLGGAVAVPATVNNTTGTATNVGTRWGVQISFQDGTQVGGVPATVAAPVTLGFAFFDQNGQFINTSGTAGGAVVHATGAAPAAAQGNLLNVTQWGGPAPPGGPAIPSAIGMDLALQTSLAGPSTPTTVSQNGYTQGTLSNISIAQDGSVNGAFSNGQNTLLAQVAVATFQNEQGLIRNGSSTFSASANSGLAQVGTAAAGRFGAIVSGSLEQSNVSLADEFTKMIFAQRAFEANSKSITTADQDLQTVINIKR